MTKKSDERIFALMLNPLPVLLSQRRITLSSKLIVVRCLMNRFVNIDVRCLRSDMPQLLTSFLFELFFNDFSSVFCFVLLAQKIRITLEEQTFLYRKYYRTYT